MDRTIPIQLSYCCALLLALLATPQLRADLGDDVPNPAYYLGLQAFYSGEYREAERGFRQETQRGIRTVQARWIDSICYHAMLGEVYYNQGRNPQALAEFDQACQLMLAYPNWLLRVKFNQPPRPDAIRARRAPPWGQSTRQFVLGQFSTTEQVLVGELDSASKALQQGGVVSQPQFWRVNITEVVRASTLAIRRRNELLGPLAPYDRISKELNDMFARGNLAPPNHWSTALVDLQRGLALIGMGRYDEANTVLGRAVIVDGQYDHPLTCVALMEQGRLAMFRGDSRAAAQLFLEASYSAFYYENWDTMTESLWLGWYNHMAMGGGGVYPPLDVVAGWAQANRLGHAATKLRLAEAETLVAMGQLPQAAAMLEDVTRRMGDMRNALPGIHQQFVEAAIRYAQGNISAGNQLLDRALTLQAGASIRNFQIARCSGLYDAREISPRVAGQLYSTLLADPTTSDWVYQPLDSMAVLKTPQDAAFDRWLMSALERKEIPQSIEIAEQTKRRRYLASLPWGGRLAALRSILEAPENDLSRDAILQRQQLLTNFPAYRELSATGNRIYDELRGGPIVAAGGNTKAINDRYDAWRKNAEDREHILAQLAVRHVPSTSDFPPLRTTADLQTALGEGEAMVIFHAAGSELYGFLLSKTDTFAWQLGDVRRLKTALGTMLRAVGNYGANRSITVEELQNDKWRDTAASAYQAVFAEARLDLSQTKSLAIVPDGLLWYLPFEALIPPDGDGTHVLADQVPIRYGPLASLAVSDPRPLRRPLHTGIVVSQLAASDAESGDDMVAQLEKAVTEPVRLPMPLPEPGYLIAPLLDELVALDDVEAEGTSALGWSPLPRSRGVANDTLEAWYGLPFGGPERIILTGVATAAEQGLKTSRRGGVKGGEPGSEIFQSVCGLMANGGRTILLTRWRTSGRTNFELVREFVQELPHASATEAWQRSCLLAREALLDASREPRLKRKDNSEELPTADHPFFWAGYLLVDTSPSRVDDKKPEKPTAAKGDVTKVMPLPPPAAGSNPLAPPSPTLPASGRKPNETAPPQTPPQDGETKAAPK